MNKFIALLLGVLAAPAMAATPESGTLTLDEMSLEYTAGPFAGANIAHQGDGGAAGPTCASPLLECDEFSLTLDFPEGIEIVYPAALVRIQWGWEDFTGTGLSDFDCWVLDPEGNVVSTSGVGSNNPEAASLLIEGGVTEYVLTCVPFSAIGESFTGKAEIVLGEPAEIEEDESGDENGSAALGAILMPSSDEPEEAQGRSTSAGSAGSLGWMLLPLSLLAWRRRIR